MDEAILIELRPRCADAMRCVVLADEVAVACAIRREHAPGAWQENVTHPGRRFGLSSTSLFLRPAARRLVTLVESSLQASVSSADTQMLKTRTQLFLAGA